jgi:hemolysin activation/secretion protein
MDNERNDLVVCRCILALGQDFSVSASRGSTGGLLGGLLIGILICYPAVAGRDQPALRLLVLGHDSQPIQPARPTGVDDSAVPTLATPPARAATSGFIGQPIDDALVADIRNWISTYYDSIGRPFITITIPEQDIAAGTLRVNIIETKVGRIKVEGNHWFGDQVYLRAIRTRPGDPIDKTNLAADADWINRDDHRHGTISVGPGVSPATYDLTVRAKDRLPLDVALAADNTGTADTGLYRIGLAIDWSNAMWRGDDLNYGFLTSPDGFRLLENSVSYTTYLPWRDSVTISVVNAGTRGMATGSSNASSVNGHADIVSFRYGLAMPSFTDFVHRIDLGYDFKTTNNNILAGGNAVFPTISELDQFIVAYTVRRDDPFGIATATAILTASPGHLTPRNTEGALGAQQPGASPTYVYGRLSIERLTNLHRETAWNARLTAQYSRDNLLPSEQLVFGGIQSIRGFMELGATRDMGVLMQNEFRLAPISFQTPPDGGAMVPFAFLDVGAGRNHQDLAGKQRSWLEMGSAGPGLNWHFTQNIALRLSWGFPLIRNGHTGAFLGPQFGTQINF